MPLTDENFGGRVVDSDGLEDGGAVVGHCYRAILPTAQQDLVLKQEKTRGVSPQITITLDVLTDKMTPTIPFGPSVLFTKSPTAMAPTKEDCKRTIIIIF